MSEIGDLFTKYGSDKDTNHKYGDFYQALFSERADVKHVLEIGVAHGGGLLGFRDFYPNALCVGIDNQYSPVAGDRIEMHSGVDATDFEGLMQAINGRQFDLIVEDAAHRTEDNLRILFWLWPYLKPGGHYVIEEWQNVQRDVLCFDIFKGARLVETPYPFKPGHHAYVDHEPPELLVSIWKP